jgi:hypothetical protein
VWNRKQGGRTDRARNPDSLLQFVMVYFVIDLYVSSDREESDREEVNGAY